LKTVRSSPCSREPLVNMPTAKFQIDHDVPLED
jgi:hypothetical protein